MTTFLIIMAIWLGLNIAFVAIRLYVSADREAVQSRSFAIVRHPRLIS